ncbi:uncharacterized protein BJ212DRAFT_1298285 [Suillus subaureus]|uniref:Uncharacterized protein n=1 Tax=Suillus subaureus TaxID=48587 RepID=A0A9P7EEK9_9AGAM|nr:uncharacterized protein BJ212DRAFT_1298285 [Suillus subaureus]KAG1818985.1 hypothetical protein BJ212DRAFT_1298285 [Suillus subaureus]
MTSQIASLHSIANTASSTSLSPSLSNLNALSSPKPAHQRRMTASALPPPTSLNLPEPVYGHPGHAPGSPRRPPSPLRNEFTHRRFSNESHSGDDDDNEEEDQDRTWPRSRSPTSASVTQFAANLANRVNSFISPSVASRPLPSDEELEAEAQRERDRSRREAERILTREAEERRAMEERVLAMMNSSPRSLPLPRSRSQTLPNPPSPAHSQKDSSPSWWTAAKARLTPTKDKEPLTPAQQVIEETKAREKETKSAKGRENEWPASSTSKYTNPAYLNLKIPPGGPPCRTSSPTSPTPVRTPVNLSPARVTQAPINLSPASIQRGTSPGGSPAREPPPLYASFTPSGTLDVPGTLLLIAKRFEKLERWSVTHVRALEERMGDVERWLVDKENQCNKESSNNDKHSPGSKLAAIQGDVTELQSRMSELGREMARLATSPAVFSSNSAIRSSPVMDTTPSMESSIVSPHESTVSSAADTTFSEFSSSNTTPALENIRSLSTPRRAPSLTARESTSPPLARASTRRTPSGSRTRLPYPTGDYASPGELISPPHTPASSPPPPARPASMVIAGLPALSSPLELPAAITPPGSVPSPSLSGLPAPSTHSPRRGSVSPSPLQAGRKRYTVALGGPIVAPPEVELDYGSERSGLGTASFSSTAESSDDDADDEDYQNAIDETLGKKSAFRMMTATKLSSSDLASVAPANNSPGNRARAQSTYGGLPNPLQSNQSVSAQSMHRYRSQSIDFRSDSTFGGDQANKFVDPLVLRRQEKTEKGKEKPLVGPGKKVPVGQLVAFFDSERR